MNTRKGSRSVSIACAALLVATIAGLYSVRHVDAATSGPEPLQSADSMVHGINGHASGFGVYEGWLSAPKLDEFFAKLQKMGVKSYRYNPRSDLAYGESERIVDAAAKYDIDILMSLPSACWAITQGYWKDAWGDADIKLAYHFAIRKNPVTYFEICNEADLGILPIDQWDSKGRDAEDFNTPKYRQIVLPGIRYVMSGLRAKLGRNVNIAFSLGDGPHWGLIQKLKNDGIEPDFISLHWYNGPHMKVMIDKLWKISGGKPIFVTEFNSNPDHPRYNQEEQANIVGNEIRWMESYRNQQTGAHVSRMYFYEVFDQKTGQPTGNNAAFLQNNYGLFMNGSFDQPKPVASVLAKLYGGGL
jgi:Glycosyl hydrolase catalytic core